MNNKINKATCSTCKGKFDKKQLKEVNSKERYCEKCNEERVRRAKSYNQLIKYICQGFGLKQVTYQQLNSIKKFNRLGYTYEGIMYTLYYIFSVEKKRVNGTSIELVSEYYEKARRYAEENKETNNKLRT